MKIKMIDITITMDLRELLTNEVLEQGISNMIIDNITDMEEVRMDNFHIRKTHQSNYKIYKLGGEEIFFNTHIDYDTEQMKQDPEHYFLFVKAFINAMRNSDRISNDIVKDIISDMVLYAFKKSKDTIIHFISEDDIDDYIKLGISDGLQDIIYRSQYEPEIREIYSDYDFNYQNHQILIEEEDMENLQQPDRDWLEQNGWGVGSNINEDDFIVESDVQELERFKIYLDSRGELTKIETLVIRFYLEQLIYPYSMDYNNFIRYIMGEPREETDEEDEEMA